MSDLPPEGFEPDALHVVDEPDPFPGEDQSVTPDHRASAEPSVVQRVKERARERSQSRATGTSTNTRKSAPKPPRRAVPKITEAALTRSLTELYGSVGMMILPFDPTCGQIIIARAETCAASLAAVAQTNDAVRRVLLAITATSAWGGVMIAHVPILLVILAHHGSDTVKQQVQPLATMMMMDPATFAPAPPSDETPADPEAGAA